MPVDGFCNVLQRLDAEAQCTLAEVCVRLPWWSSSLREQQWLRLVVRLIAWLRQQEPVTLLVMLLVVVGSWSFIELADEVMEGTTQTLDTWMVRVLRQPDRPELPRGPRWVAEAGRDITALGSYAVLSLVVAAVAGFLRLQRHARAMWLVLLASVGGALISHLLKIYYDRERPPLLPLADTMTPSFPSGHSMLSAVIYLSLGVLLAQTAFKRRVKAYFLTVALVLTFLVGVSRIYLGVHYPTDVLAGWTVGLVWALGCWLAGRVIRQ
jgi:undecaprenyl-diphosphatase